MILSSDWILTKRETIIQSPGFNDLVSQTDCEGRYQLYELERHGGDKLLGYQEMFKISQNCQIQGQCVINRVFEGYCFLNWQMI